MSFPVHDWQFWAVTAVFAGAAAWMAKSLIPRAKHRRTRRATLTIEGRPAAGPRARNGSLRSRG